MDERQQVVATEFVYRRIHHVYFHADLARPVDAAAFRPNQSDTTGLSVFRALFCSQPEDTLANVDAAKRSEYFVVRLAVQDLLHLGLTVTPDPDPNGPPGHAVIPELSWPEYQARKQRLKKIHVELAQLASGAIVHRPSY
jgi:hypothetical protein